MSLGLIDEYRYTLGASYDMRHTAIREEREADLAKVENNPYFSSHLRKDTLVKRHFEQTMVRDMAASSWSNNKIVTIVIEKNDVGRLAGIGACSRTEAPPEELQPCMDNTVWHAFVGAFNEELAIQKNADYVVTHSYFLNGGGLVIGMLVVDAMMFQSDNWWDFSDPGLFLIVVSSFAFSLLGWLLATVVAENGWDFPGLEVFLIVSWYAFSLLGWHVGILIRSRLRDMVLDEANLELTRVCDEHSSERVRFSFSNNCSLYRETVYEEDYMDQGPANIEYLRCHDIQAHISAGVVELLRYADDPAMKHSEDDSLAEDALGVTTSETGTTDDGELYSRLCMTGQL
jgi:hypothetical protein